MRKKPATMRPQVYRDPRPKEYFDRFHQRVRTHQPGVVYNVVRFLVKPFCRVVFRVKAIDQEYIPTKGPFILAPNHFSFMDHFLVAMFSDQKVSFIAKSQLFKPLSNPILYNGCAIPVRRGMRDQEMFISAQTVLARLGSLLIYCEGGRSRSGQLSEKVRPGLGRLALETGVPVIPVAVYGSARIRNWKRLKPPPQVTVQFGKPLVFPVEHDASRQRQQQVAEEVFAEVRRMYEGLKSS